MPRLYFDSTRYADLPLHHGRVPPWLAERLAALGEAIVEATILEYGNSAITQRLSDPFWFQTLGTVMGMDWHSSGLTTSVMGALKKAVNRRFNEFGIYICGGKGKHSRKTPDELLALAEHTGLNGTELVRSSKLSAKVDNTALQDGFQIYLHSFIVTNRGEWTVIQQGMNDTNGMARRYHWHSVKVKSFVESPHTFIYGKNQGEILNLTDSAAQPTKAGILDIVKEDPVRMLQEIRKIVMPSYNDVCAKDINVKLLESTIGLAHEKEVRDFESLLLLDGLGPRTLQSLALVSEIIYGTPSRFTDPARLSFADGGPDGYHFPGNIKVYDETIHDLKVLVEKAKIRDNEKHAAIKNLTMIAQNLEKGFEAAPDAFDKIIERERTKAYNSSDRTVFRKSKVPKRPDQLQLF